MTEIMLAVFRLQGRLLKKGDELVKPLNLTSAKWQVVGAVALAGKPLSAPQIAEAMGITRQGAHPGSTVHRQKSSIL
ncbi:MarR family transcriptional regulator [Acidithiobacillus ferridurans]|uniref:MarR family transcriptional regulator n=1 Tax=Acidithiobacillus ferridurans TaxID=1232575 RepID=UPI001C0744B0|nr:MarR family transcriptional regulator [Acidithiobacillus ferridurans]MBU2805784.1 MarR family transcriptional regulator [Acidithiobacillus ferridurans]